MSKRAGILTRVSTPGQVDNTSLGEQERLCAEYARSRGWEVVGVYTDEAMSGVNSQRPAYLRLLADARAGKLDAIIALEGSRFSRDEVERGTQTRDLVLNFGVTVCFINDIGGVLDPEDPELESRWLGNHIQAGFDGEERRKFRARTNRGRRAKLRNGGTYVGGRPPYGYRVEGIARESRVVPDEQEREALRTAYRLIVNDGMSTPATARELDRLGLKPRMGGKWEMSSLRRALRHPVLVTGRVTWGVPPGAIPKDRHRNTSVTPMGRPLLGEPIEIEYGHPLFSEAEWYALQGALDDRTRRSGQDTSAPQASQLMTKRVQAKCGETYFGVNMARSSKNKIPYVYRCSGRRSSRAKQDRCSDSQLRGPELDHLVWSAVVRALTEGDTLAAMARHWAEGQVAERSVLDQLQRQRERLTAKRDRALDLMLESPELSPALRQKAEQLQQQVADLEGRIQAAQASDQHREARHREVLDLVALVAGARERLEGMDRSSRAEVIRLLDIRLVVGDVYAGVPISGELVMNLDGLGALANQPTAIRLGDLASPETRRQSSAR